MVINEKQLEKLGAFEISSEMLKLAKKNQKSNVFLNAGRGNPNWINTLARLAFCRIMEFGVRESRLTIDIGDMAGYVQTNGIYNRLLKFLSPDDRREDKFIVDSLTYLDKELDLPLDEVVAEMTNGIIGNNYPVPNRILKYSEIILNKYLESTLYDGEKLADSTDLFATEGGTAAIVYAFHSLSENHLLKPGDKVAINTPIFTPYLEIPELNDYELMELDLGSHEKDDWEIRASELEKLADPSVKAFFVVNPSNPGSKAFDRKALTAVKHAIEKNPNLMIITDDVYGTFVSDFKTIYSVAPHNTMLVYSFSKLYGATGWRLGLIGLNQENIFDKKISELDETDKKELATRYEHVVVDPAKMKFIDRITADSRSVGLYHTSGLSTPQQIMEDLFALTHLVYASGSVDSYINESRLLVNRRYEDLYKSIGAKEDVSRTNAKYYSLIDIYKIAEEKYGSDFEKYLEDNFEQVDFLLKLAEKNGVVLMDGVGFGSKAGELRVSEANLPTKKYKVIGQQVLDLLQEYHESFEKKNK
ncbi:bifunctional aspartate transaminase/aspartate 4-decarboxylase [Lactobacillus agrestimuris]|uniref:bifunctional aspartate transaminase/aspartate 4-decarboxylase n=1 Tax=Lactobacillus agrestimuris TaxID=2941328 RepID=UPI002043144E|nr:bifunctional aspartate transaminase/aspartate 4-decarboxylase [Lactobacillus agrestimuris]